MPSPNKPSSTTAQKRRKSDLEIDMVQSPPKTPGRTRGAGTSSSSTKIMERSESNLRRRITRDKTPATTPRRSVRARDDHQPKYSDELEDVDDENSFVTVKSSRTPRQTPRKSSTEISKSSKKSTAQTPKTTKPTKVSKSTTESTSSKKKIDRSDQNPKTPTSKLSKELSNLFIDTVEYSRKTSTIKPQTTKTPVKRKSSPIADDEDEDEDDSVEILDESETKVDEKTMRNLLASFDLAKVPHELPCRETELKEIRDFVESNLNAETSGCIYVSGVPGTGKTASIRLVMQQLEKEQRRLPKFVFVEVNGLLVSDPKRIIVEFHKALWKTKKFFPDTPRISPPAARRILNRVFEMGDDDRPAIVLLLDEIDALVTKRQQHLYQILDWPNQDGAKLIIMAVANTLDFPERALSNRNNSRMGLKRLCFKPYDHKQIKNILINRLRNSEAVEPTAVEYVARKVASVSGDVRRAFEICRIAIQFVLTDANENGGESMTPAKRGRKNQGAALCGPMTQEHADRALKKLAMNVKVQAIRKASTHEKLLLESAMAENRRIGLDEIAFNQIWHHYQIICKEREKKPLCVDELLDVAMRLVDCRLMLGVPSSSRQDFTAKYRLNVNIGDLHLALGE